MHKLQHKLHSNFNTFDSERQWTAEAPSTQRLSPEQSIPMLSCEGYQTDGVLETGFIRCTKYSTTQTAISYVQFRSSYCSFTKQY